MTEREIILVHLSSHPGGVELLVPSMIRGLPQYSFSSFVVRPPFPGKPDVYDNTGISRKNGSHNSIIAAVRLFAFAFPRRDRVFHVFNIGPVFLLTLRIAGVRNLIYSVHGTRYWKSRTEKIILKLLWKLALSKKYIVTSNSVFSGEVFSRDVLEVRNIIVLYNPINPLRFKPQAQGFKNPENGKIIYCGRLDKGKNLDEWIRVAVMLREHYPQALFEIYGDGAERDNLARMIKELNAESYITLKGYISVTEDAYREAALLIFLSEYESFGNVVVESILCGTPVITSSIPSMKEIFQHFPQFLVELDQNLSGSILEKIRNYKELVIAVAAARSEFIERFSPEMHFKKLAEIYEECARVKVAEKLAR